MRVDDIRIVNPVLVKNKIRDVKVSGAYESRLAATFYLDDLFSVEKRHMVNEEIRLAMIDSLKSAGIYHSKGGKYELSVEFVSSCSPVLIANCPNETTVKYKLVDYRTQSVLFERTVLSEGFAYWYEKLNAGERRRLANERGMKNNIKSLFHFIDFEYGL